jgi:sec-independent protein translocase protein TatB
MFDIGFWEMLMIAVIGLLVIGPKRLPEVARALGRWTAKLKNFVASTRADLEREFNSTELRNMLEDKQDEINELRQMINDTRASIEDTSQKIETDVKSEATVPTSSGELDAPQSSSKDDAKA